MMMRSRRQASRSVIAYCVACTSDDGWTINITKPYIMMPAGWSSMSLFNTNTAISKMSRCPNCSSRLYPWTCSYSLLSCMLRGLNNKVSCFLICSIKDKGFPYSLPSVEPGANPGVQAVNPQVTISHPPGGRLPLPSPRPAVTCPATEHHRPLAVYNQVILVGDRST